MKSNRDLQPNQPGVIRVVNKTGRAGGVSAAVSSILWIPGILLLAAASLHAASPVDIYGFPSAEVEARYRALIDEFRCPKCLNTNLAGSDAPIARDLRRTVHRLVVEEGLADQEIRDYLQARYGDFVLYDPPFRPGTWVLWLAPAGFAIVGFWVLFRVLRRTAAQPDDLTAEERARLREIVGDGRRG